MSDRHDDDAFVRSVADLYAAPPLAPSQRTRFDARLEERLQQRATRPAPWLAAGAVAAAALAAVLWFAPATEKVVVADESDAALEAATTPEEWILAMGSDSLSDSDDALPPDYVAISDLLLGN